MAQPWDEHGELVLACREASPDLVKRELSPRRTGGQSAWAEFALTQVRVQLSAGENKFAVLIQGSAIAKAGRDGPYASIVPIEVFPVGGEGYALASPVFTTPAYKASQFH